MDNKLFYKVLWVDDQEFPALPTVAERYGIDITQVRCWTDAKPYLEEDHFDDWSALILDCYCSIEPNGPENEKFLREVFADFNRMQGKKRTLPWYVLSQGNKERFDQLMDLTLSEQRLKWDRNWEKGYYSKSAISISPIDGKEKPDYQIMLENIQKVAEQTVHNKVRAKYPEAFNAARYLGGMIEHDLLEFLVNDYNNDLNGTHKYFNWVRNIMEGIFKHGKKKKIFPPLNDTNGFGRLLYKGSTNDYEIKNYDNFIPKVLGYAFSFLLEFSNRGSHNMAENDVQEYVTNTHNINLFRALLYIEMDLLVWYHELCMKVEDPHNADFTIGNLWGKTKPITPLTNVVVQYKRTNNKDRFYVEKDGICVELIVKYERTRTSKLKEGVFVDVVNWKPDNRNSDITKNCCFEGQDGYQILYKKVTVYDQNNNELKSDSMDGKMKAKAIGTGEQYQGLPHEVIVSPIDGYYINSIRPSSSYNNQIKEIENSYIKGKIALANLNDDLTIHVEILQCPNLIIKSDIENSGSVSGGGIITPNSIVPISATPSQGYEFMEWQGYEVKDKKSQKTTLTMPTKDVSLVAIFKKKDE